MADEQKFRLTLAGEGVTVDKDVAEGVARRILNIVFGGDGGHATGPGRDIEGAESGTGGEHDSRDMSPKAFMAEKKPSTDIERVTCLAFFLTHHLKTPTFQTRDLSKLNGEAHQPKLSNPTVAVNNASRQRYLTPSGGGKKRITTLGEEVVRALPDREAVKQALASQPGRRRSRLKKRSPAKAKSA
jgi:hypothetical protein